jgi:hypothetical protein
MTMATGLIPTVKAYGMALRRTAMAVAALFAFSIVWNGLVHLLVLREAEQAVAAFARPVEDRNMVLALLLTVILATVFVWSYAVSLGRGGLRRGLTHGLFFALLAGLLVDLNQYLIYLIPGELALAWFVFGALEICVWGLDHGQASSVSGEHGSETCGDARADGR